MDSNELPLGRKVEVPQQLDPSVLCAVSRQEARAECGISAELPFDGFDLWNCYELSWLNPKGVPQVALAQIQYSCATRSIVESKSLKLFLGSFYNTEIASIAEVGSVITSALNEIVSGECRVDLWPAAEWSAKLFVPQGVSIDDSELAASAELTFGAENVVETLNSNLLRTLCPITAQPDWGTLVISYVGPKLQNSSLLSYLKSLRTHAAFHESTAEIIFMDLLKAGSLEKLLVGCYYTRRGGIDINSVRYTPGFEPENEYQRLVRQ